jgi:hypothetical protein
VNTSPGRALFFGIIKSSEPIVDESSALTSAYGYWSDKRPVRAGMPAALYEDVRIQSNDVVSLTLDCSSKKLKYMHERTQMSYEIEVDQQICPLPWKLVVTLWFPDDAIEILN